MMDDASTWEVAVQILLLILVLGTVLEDAGELHVVEHPVLDRGLSVHLIHLKKREFIKKSKRTIENENTKINWRKIANAHIVVGETITHGDEKLPKTVLVDEPGVVLVEASESVLDHLFRICSLETLAEQSQEHREVDRARSFLHHALEVLVRGILP